MRRVFYGLAAVYIAIGVLALVLVAYSHIHRPSVPEAVTFKASDRMLLTLEQQRELVNDHRTAVYICGELNVFEWDGGKFPEELKPYMWAYPE